MSAHRILIVDDDEDARASLGVLCELIGHEVRTAANGLQATEVARQWHPDAVVLDMEMPVMDGLTAAHELRCNCGCTDTVIVGVSGRPAQDTGAQACAAGCNAYFQKPVDFDRLAATIERYCDGGDDSVPGWAR